MGLHQVSSFRKSDQSSLKEKTLIPWVWATNAFPYVVNSIFALLLAFWEGHEFVLMLAAVSYLLAFPVINISK